MKSHTFRCRIARMNDGAIQIVTYIGPRDRVPFGWSRVSSVLVRRAAA